MTKTRDLANLVSGSNPLVDGVIDYSEVTNTPTLASVATSGSFNDLSNQPTPFDPATLAAVATTGAYADVTGTPALAAVATTGAYADVTGTPAFASQAEAEAGTNTTKLMTPALVGQSIAALRPSSTPELLYSFPTTDALISTGYSAGTVFILFKNLTTNALYLKKSTDGITWADTGTAPSLYPSTSVYTTSLYADDNWLVITQQNNSPYTTSYIYASNDLGETWSSATQTYSNTAFGGSDYHYDGTYYWNVRYNEPTSINTWAAMRTTNFQSWTAFTGSSYTGTYNEGPYSESLWVANGIIGRYWSNYIFTSTKQYSSNYGTTWIDENKTKSFTYKGVTYTTSTNYSAYDIPGPSTVGFNNNYIKLNFRVGDWSPDATTAITGNQVYCTVSDFLANATVPCSTYSEIGNYPDNAQETFFPSSSQGHNDFLNYNSTQRSLYHAESFTGVYNKLLYDSYVMGGNFTSSRFAKTNSLKLYLANKSDNLHVTGVNVWSM